MRHLERRCQTAILAQVMARLQLDVNAGNFRGALVYPWRFDGNQGACAWNRVAIGILQLVQRIGVTRD